MRKLEVNYKVDEENDEINAEEYNYFRILFSFGRLGIAPNVPKYADMNYYKNNTYYN